VALHGDEVPAWAREPYTRGRYSGEYPKEVSIVSTVFVAGATGRLGGPVAHLLIARGHDVLAGTRDPRSRAAQALARRGARIARADFDDVPSLTAAARGSDAVVAAGTAHRAGPDGERRHGVNLAEAVARAGAPLLVYVSGAGAERPSDVPVFESKRAVEQRIRALGLVAAVLAPVYLMENALNPWNVDALLRGRLALALAPDRALQQVALAPPLRTLFAWLERVGFAIDVPALRERHPEVGWRSFERWAAEQSWPG